MILKRHVEAIEHAAREAYYYALPAQRAFDDWEKQKEDVRESWRERVRFILNAYKEKYG